MSEDVKTLTLRIKKILHNTDAICPFLVQNPIKCRAGIPLTVLFEWQAHFACLPCYLKYEECPRYQEFFKEQQRLEEAGQKPITHWMEKETI